MRLGKRERKALSDTKALSRAKDYLNRAKVGIQCADNCISSNLWITRGKGGKDSTVRARQFYDARYALKVARNSGRVLPHG